MAGNNGKGDKGDQRDGGPKNIWHSQGPTWRIGDEEFKFKMPRGQEADWNIGAIVESCSWDDAEAMMTGSITMRYKDEKRMSIEEGDEIECLFSKKGEGRFTTLWKMRVVDPDYDVGEGIFSCSLEDDLALLARSKDDWRYVRGEKKNKDGWLASKIAEDVCKRYGVQADIAKTQHQIKRIEKKNASPLDVINKVYKVEREHTGRRFVIRFIEGKLVIEPLQRNTFLALLKEQILSALYTQNRHKEFATRLTVRGSTDKKKKEDKREKKRIEVEVESKEMRQRFGVVHRFEDRKNLDTNEEAKDVGERQLAKKAELGHKISISHLGVPMIRRGHAIRVDLENVPHFSTPRIVFVKEVHHSLAAGEYTMELVLGEDDPYRDAKKERECLLKCEKAAKEGHEPPKECDCPGWIDFNKDKDKSDKDQQRDGNGGGNGGGGG